MYPFEPPENPYEVRYYCGKLYVWDNTPEVEFGQTWIPVCFWCNGGPLDDKDGLICIECEQKGKANPQKDATTGRVGSSLARQEPPG